MTDRTEYFTDAEFDALPRYESGRIMDLPAAYPFITKDQVFRLHSDDFSYYHELEEETAYELHMALEDLDGTPPSILV